MTFSETIKQSIRAKNLGTRKNRPISGIVLHDTAGSGTHNDTLYLANPGDSRGVSVDFTVERDGEVYQLNSDLENRYCFHAGRATIFKQYAGPSVNVATIGIEIVQKANLSLIPIWPEKQVEAVGQLCHYLCTRFNLKKEDITTHQRIITDGSRSDPRKWPWSEFWHYYNNESISIGGLDIGITHNVVPGDTLYSIAVKYTTTIEKLKALNGLNTSSNNIYVGQVLLVKE